MTFSVRKVALYLSLLLLEFKKEYYYIWNKGCEVRTKWKGQSVV